MTRRDHAPSFLSEAVLGLALSVAAAALAASFSLLLPAGLVLRAVVAALGLIYVLYTLGRSRVRIGKAVVFAFWSTGAVLAWWLTPSLAVYIAAHAAMLWLIRSLYAYSSLVSAAMDLGLGIVSLAVAVWALDRSDSLLLASWCFFLVQALHVAIPRQGCRRAPAEPADLERDQFGRAHRMAESALRRLASNS